jgi:DNA-binding transcriptional ArsR family regulator
LTQTPYDWLISVLDAYIEEYGGRLRLRGVITALLVLKRSLEGEGISISEVSRVTGAPLENVRRHFGKYVEQGYLNSRIDPCDERVTRYFFLDIDAERDRGLRVARALHAAGSPQPRCSPQPEKVPRFSAGTCDALMEVLDAFTTSLDSSMRIRAFKIVIALHQASLTSEGMTPSQIARVGDAPLETVRRRVQQYVDAGDLMELRDPDDERAHRLLYRDPSMWEASISATTNSLAQVDWSQFNTR